MKKILSLALLGLLCACGSAPVTYTSFNGMHYTSGPTSINDPRLGQRTYYSDDADHGWWMHASNPGVN